VTVTVKSKTPLVVPPSALRKAGIRSGDKLKFDTKGGVITIEKEFEEASGEYTPEQLKVLHPSLVEEMKEYKRGEFIQFDSVEEMAAYLKKRRAARRANKIKK
jgi:bifunctional DNA-binding transcriptional regulator/antitoxin component of YhaV-PrlF toxin-antitoxin module